MCIRDSGVVGMIYEARPNVTVDAACLCLKSANACILRGGKEAIRSNTAFAEIMCGALEGAGLPRDGIQLVTDTSRASAGDLMTLDGYLDALIPRGGKGLIQAVVKGASVPVIETGAGNCHIYVDDSADLEMAVRVCDNAKTSRPSVCNAVETVLVHREIAAAFLPRLKEALDVHHVELRGCARTAALIPGVVPAAEEDYDTEFDDYILALRVVEMCIRDSCEIITETKKFQMLEKWGVRLLLSPDFTAFSAMPPEEFVDEVLVRRLGAAVVCCGDDFRFGRDAAGDVPMLKTLCAARGVEVDVVPAVLWGGCLLYTSRCV